MLDIPVDTVPLTEGQRMVREGIRDVCADFDDAYWRACDDEERYPMEFFEALAEGGWFGLLIPEEYGGAGMGTPESVAMFEAIAAGGGGFSAAQAVHGGIYASWPIVKHGGEELKAELLPALASGEASIQSFGLTEPNAGSDSTAMETRARREGGAYVVDGGKIWISRVDVSDYLLLMARTTPREEVARRTDGISMFLVDIEDARQAGTLEMEPVPKTAAGMVGAYQLWFDGLRVDASRLVGEAGEGFSQMLSGLNEERLVIAAECVGLGELAVDRGVRYATEREVFDRPIGKNQAVQHPLAAAYARVQAAKSVTYAAADAVAGEDGRTVGARANVAKYLAAEAAFEAADAAVQAHGGFGVAREYDVERYFREARLTRLVPIAQELVLNYVGEKVLGLPRSY